ncbi:MAG: hypothetical protein HFJ36_00745 [Clostridia bacterium]|nr:hypothetical protein [Clostridia bacterium]
MNIIDTEKFNLVKQNIEDRFELCMYLSHTNLTEDRIMFPDHFSEYLIREILHQVLPGNIIISQVVNLPMPLSQTLVIFSDIHEEDN